MLGNQNTLVLAGIAVVAAAVWGWFSGKSKKLKEDQFNRELRARLESDLKEAQRTTAERISELDKREAFILSLRSSFEHGYISGRQWLARFVAEADKVSDDAISERLRHKKRPALKAADEVAAALSERRTYKERAKYLEYQLRSYKEYFPFLEEYEDVVLDEAVMLGRGQANIEALVESDPVLRFVPKSDYDRLSPAERNQLALDRYLSGGLTPVAVGRLYERYVGYRYEREGWTVEYHGIIKGLEDLGRDLICTRGNDVHVVQLKCWSKSKTIHEKHIFQLYGTTQLYLMGRKKEELFAPAVTPRFITSTTLSQVARQAAAWLKINVMEEVALDKSFPMIKCNINQSTKERIYHLPFDQQYDRTKILFALGERYVATVAEAEQFGFRRAFRHQYTPSSA